MNWRRVAYWAFIVPATIFIIAGVAIILASEAIAEALDIAMQWTVEKGDDLQEWAG